MDPATRPELRGPIWTQTPSACEIFWILFSRSANYVHYSRSSFTARNKEATKSLQSQFVARSRYHTNSNGNQNNTDLCV